MGQHTKPLLPLQSSSKKRGENFSHGISVDEILATLYFFSVSPYLCGESWICI